MLIRNILLVSSQDEILALSEGPLKGLQLNGSVMHGLVCTGDLDMSRPKHTVDFCHLDEKNGSRNSIHALLSKIKHESKARRVDLIVLRKTESWEQNHWQDLIGKIVDQVRLPIWTNPPQFFSSRMAGLALDLKKFQNASQIKILTELGKSFGFEISAFHVANSVDEINSEKQSQYDRVKNILTGITTSFRTVESPGVLEGIQHFIEVHDLDLMVIMPRRYNFIEKWMKKSVSQAIIKNSTISFLSIPAD